MSIIEKLKNAFKKFWDETLGADYTDEEINGLNIKSTDQTEAILAESSEKIDKEYENFRRTSKEQRKKLLDQVAAKPEENGKNNHSKNLSSQEKAKEKSEEKEMEI